MLEYFVKDGSIFIIIVMGAIAWLAYIIGSNVKGFKEQHKNRRRLDRGAIMVTILLTLVVIYLSIGVGVGIANDRQISHAAKHDAIAKHYNFKKDGNHLLLTLKDPDKDDCFKDNILLDLSSETKDSYHVIFHDDLYNIPKSDKKQATRIENTKE